MVQSKTDISPQLYARISGIFYLILIACGFFAEFFVRSHAIVSGDPAATAHNIMAAETLYRAACASDVTVLICDVVLTMTLYVLLAPVNRNLAMLMAFFHLVAASVLATDLINHYEPLLLLNGAKYLSAFQQDQLQALAYVAIRAHSIGYNISVIFFAANLLVLSYLIVRSTFLPKLLGVIVAIAGVSYLVNCYGNILAPQMLGPLSDFLLLPGFVAELSLALWLTLRGVNAARWNQAALAAA
jgi:hypothetical protein